MDTETTTTPEELGARRRALREAAGCTQLQLAAAAGITIPTLHRAESGSPINERSLRRIAWALGVTAAEYLGGDVDMDEAS